jgi:hypothetical protein
MFVGISYRQKTLALCCHVKDSNTTKTLREALVKNAFQNNSPVPRSGDFG